MELKSGYKQTEVGVIPEDWEVSNIGQACRIVTTGKLDANAMVESGEYKFFTCAREVYQIDNYAFDCEALLISGNGAHVGYIHYYEGRFNAYQRTYVLTDFSAHIKFVQCVLENSFRDRIQTEVRAGGTPYITRSTITESPIPLPPTKAEQEAIAEALSDADALIASLEQLIAKKRLIKQGAMQELLTGKHRLPGFSGDWEQICLGDVSTFFKGKGLPKSSLTPSGADRCIHYGELFTQYGHTIKEVISRTDANADSFLSSANDVLMPTSDVTPSGLAKASCILEDGIVIGGDILVIRTETGRVNGTFLSCLIRLEEQQVLRLVTGSTVYHLYASDMKNFMLRLPSYDEQTAIATALSEIDEEIGALERKLAKARLLKQGMMQELLTGRIRLV